MAGNTGGGAVVRRNNNLVSNSNNNLNRTITVTPFLNKLYSMVDAESTNGLIEWSPAGNSFIVPQHEEFAKVVLPRFFKHSNFSSFVRQLNMYDFHKVPHLQQGGLIADDPNAESWEFSNPNFRQDQPDLMHFIRRKKGNRDGPATSTAGDDQSLEEEGGGRQEQLQQPQRLQLTTSSINNQLPQPRSTTATIPSVPQSREPLNNASASGSGLKNTGKPRASRAPPANLEKILKEIQVIKDHQLTISSDIRRLQGENQSLWMQASSAEERYKKHQDTIDKILRFLATVFRSEGRTAGLQQPLRRLISHTADFNNDDGGGGGGNIFEDDAISDILDTDHFSDQSTPPAGKKRRMESSSSQVGGGGNGNSGNGRIYEVASNATSPPESPGQRTPQDSTGRRRKVSVSTPTNHQLDSLDESTPPSTRRIRTPVPSSLQNSRALTRTTPYHRRAGFVGPPPPQNSNAPARGSSDLVKSQPSNSYNKQLSSQTKSIEKLQQEIDFLGMSLENLTRQLQSSGGGGIPAGIAANNNSGVDCLPISSMSLGTAGNIYAPAGKDEVGLDSLLTSTAINNLGLSSLAGQQDSSSSSNVMGNTEQDVTSQMLSAYDLLSNNNGDPSHQPTAVPMPSDNWSSSNNNNNNNLFSNTDSGSGAFDPNMLLEMLKTCTPEQYEHLQNFFKSINGTGSNNVPLLTAASQDNSSNASPQADNTNTPFLDFVDPNATGDDEYTQILMDAVLGNDQTQRPQATTAASGQIDPALAASLLHATPAVPTGANMPTTTAAAAKEGNKIPMSNTQSPTK